MLCALRSWLCSAPCGLWLRFVLVLALCARDCACVLCLRFVLVLVVVLVIYARDCAFDL